MHAILIVGAIVGLAAVGAAVASHFSSDETAPPRGGDDLSTDFPPWAEIQANRAMVPPVEGIVRVNGPDQVMYTGHNDKAHVAWLNERLLALAEAETNAARKRAILAYRALQGREGTTGALNTYDNQIVTWGTGWGGLGLLPQVMDKLTSSNGGAAAALARGGLRYVGNREFEVVDVGGKTVKGKADALRALRGVPELLRLLVHVARDPATREDVLDAQLRTFLEYAGNLPSQAEASSQALVNFAAHLKHWAPGFYGGGLADAAKTVPGAASPSRDVQLAERLILNFYAAARKAGGWIPDWKQMKAYWNHMIQDGLAEAQGHSFLSRSEAPGTPVAMTFGNGA